MIRIAVVEDEKSYIDQLTGYLKKYEEETGENFRITVFHDGDGITEKYRPDFDIILLDIQMRFVDGLTAAAEIRRVDSEVIIMFITSMKQYAVRGYEVDALDYILKPVSYFAFSQKLKRAIERLQRRNGTWLTLQMKNGMLRLLDSEIYYVESDKHGVIYHTRKGLYASAEPMKTVEENLKAVKFYRINNCYLVNLVHVEETQDKCAIVHGEPLQISRPRMNGFMKALVQYWGDLK